MLCCFASGSVSLHLFLIPQWECREINTSLSKDLEGNDNLRYGDLGIRLLLLRLFFFFLEE